MTVVLSPVSGWLVGRFGARPSLIVAGTALIISPLMLTGLSDSTSFAWLVASYFVFGIGFGMVNPPITNTAITGMPAEQAGVAAAIASTSRQVGQSLGVAVVGVAATAGIVGALGPGLAQASHAGWWIMTGCGVVVLVLGFVTTTRWALRTAARVGTDAPREPVAVAS
jgi:MFS family permease